MTYCTKCGKAIAQNSQEYCGSCGNPTLTSTRTPERRSVPEARFGENKKEKARKWVNGYAATGAGVAAIAIIPGATSAALFTLETTMVLHVGRIYRGQQFSKEDAVAVVGAAGFMGTIGLGTKVAMEGLTFIPIIGWAIKGGIAGSVVKTLGELIIKYFESIEHAV